MRLERQSSEILSSETKGDQRFSISSLNYTSGSIVTVYVRFQENAI